MDLIQACVSEDIGAVRALIRLGYNVNYATSQHYSTPLHIATTKGNVGIVKLLINAGANSSVRNWWGETPLDIARNKNYTDLTRMLSRGIFDACKFGAIDRVREIISTDPAAIHTAKTAIHVAAYYGHTEIAMLLIGAGVDLDWKNKNGDTALDIAARDAKDEICRMIIKAGADCSEVRGYILILYDVDIIPTDKQLKDIPIGHALYKKYYFHKAHDHMDDFGMRVDYLLKAEEYDVVSRIVAEKCGLPFGEKPEIRSMIDVADFISNYI